MKVLTIKQPWATLITEGYKEYEFRTWNTTYRGELLIHAGKIIDKEAMRRFECYHLEYPKGCIIAKCNITDCVVVDETLRKKLNQKNNIIYRGIQDRNWNGLGFKLENIQKIEPIEVNGKLGLWNYET